DRKRFARCSAFHWFGGEHGRARHEGSRGSEKSLHALLAFAPRRRLFERARQIRIPRRIFEPDSRRKCATSVSPSTLTRGNVNACREWRLAIPGTPRGKSSSAVTLRALRRPTLRAVTLDTVEVIRILEERTRLVLRRHGRAVTRRGLVTSRIGASLRGGN